MTLRKMTLLVVGLTFLGLIVAVSVTLEVTLVRHFKEVEKQSVYQNMQRAEAALDGDYTVLDLAAREWANRADIQAFLQKSGSGTLDAALADARFQEFEINLLALVDSSGNLAAGKELDLNTGLSVSLPDGLLAHLKADDLLLQNQGDSGRQNALIAVPEGPLLLSSVPIRGGGTVIAGRLLNEVEVQRLAVRVQLPMVVMPYSDPNLPADFAAARSQMKGPHDYLAEPVNEDTIAGYAMINDLYGQPAFLLRVDQSRTIYHNGRIVMNYLIFALVLAGIAFGVMMLGTLERMALAPITRLSRDVGEIAASSDASRRVAVDGAREFTRLSQGVNQMLASLELAQAEERKRMVEMGALYDTSRDFMAHSGSKEVCQSICQSAVERFGVDMAWIGVLSKDETKLDPAASSGLVLETIAPVPVDWRAVYMDEHPAAAALRANQIGVRESIQTGAEGWQPFEQSFGSMAALPLVGETGSQAVVCLYSRQSGAFTTQAQWLPSFASLAGMALEKVYLFEQVLAGRQRLQRLSRRLVEVEEEERRHIAMELHDEIGQVLTGLKLLLDADTGPLNQSVSAAGSNGRLHQARAVVNDLIGRVRQMSLDLRPAMLDDLGLMPALMWLFERYTAQTRIQVDFQHQDIENRRFSPEMETATYRVVQEGLTNAARYAGVNRVSVQLWNLENVLGIQIEDAGVGFDPEAVMANGKTRGLMGMRERATSLGGRLTIDSTPGRGTCLTVELPIGGGYLERRRNARDHSAGG